MDEFEVTVLSDLAALKSQMTSLMPESGAFHVRNVAQHAD